MRKSVSLDELVPSMVIDEPVTTRSGMVIVHAGTRVTLVLLERMRSFRSGLGIVEPLHVTGCEATGVLAFIPASIDVVVAFVQFLTPLFLALVVTGVVLICD